jgi:hypothetical protein
MGRAICWSSVLNKAFVQLFFHGRGRKAGEVMVAFASIHRSAFSRDIHCTGLDC